MSQELVVASILNGLANGFTKGMAMRQAKDQAAADNQLKQQELGIRQKEIENNNAYKEATLTLQAQKAAIDELTRKAQVSQGEEKIRLEREIALRTSDYKNRELEQKGIIASLQNQLDEKKMNTPKPLLPEQRGLISEKINTEKAKQKKLNSEANKPKESKPTPGQTQLEKDFAKEYSDWTAKGGMATAQKNLNSLQEAIDSLKSGKATTGGAYGYIPDFFGAKSKIMPESSNAEQQARSTVTGLLRQTLGAQFTEKEGERIFNQNYDASLPVQKNIEKLTALKDQLTSSISEKQSMMDQFEKTGKITGYKASRINVASPKPSVGNLYPESVEKGINAVMMKNGITRDQAISALKKAGKI